MIIKGGTVVPMDGPDIPDGYVLIRDGKIAAVGPASQAPEDGEAVDAGGGYILPGLVDAHSHLGLVGDSLSSDEDDDNECSAPCTAQLRAVDAVNPMDRYFRDARRGGVTTVVTGPGSGNPISGQMAAIKTAGRWVDDMVVMAPCAMKMAMGENPKHVYGKHRQSPMTRMAVAGVIRENLRRAAEYRARQEAAEADFSREGPAFDPALEALVPVLDGDLPVHFHAHRADDIATAVRIAKEFGLKYVIVHGTEGHLIADLLAREGAAVITGPCMTDRSKPELAFQTGDNPAVLNRAGVPVAICTDHPETPEQYLILCAAMAVREGMPEKEALLSVTLRAARIAGIDSRVGSLTPGKDGDVAVFSGPPLDVQSRVTALFINGKRVEL